MARNRVNAKGRSDGHVERFIGIRRSLLHSPQFSALSCTSRALFFELQTMFNGTNNGAIFLSVRDATARLGLSDYKAAQAALRELRQLGWITEAMAGSFTVKAGEISRARAWQLNWIGRDGKSTGPDVLPALNCSTLTKAQRARVERRQKTLSRYLKDYQRGRFTVEESPTMNARMEASAALSVEESTTPKNGKGGNQPIRHVGESTTHIKYHSPVAAEAVAARRARLWLAVLNNSIGTLSNNQNPATSARVAA